LSIQLKILKGLCSFTAVGWRASLVSGALSLTLGLISPRKEVALENIAVLYPEKELKWRKQFLKEVYRHLSWSVSEYMSLMKDPSLVKNWVKEVSGEEYLDELKDRGRGAIVLTGHIGNWEILAAWLCARGYPLQAITRDPNNRAVADLTNECRTSVGLVTIPKNRVLSAARSAKKGNFVGILADQDGGRTGITLPFWDKACSTVTGPAVLSLTADVPIVPVFSYRLRPFEHRVVVRPPISTGVGGLSREDLITEITLRCNRELEKAIEHYPHQWLWLHRRWR